MYIYRLFGVFVFIQIYIWAVLAIRVKNLSKIFKSVITSNLLYSHGHHSACQIKKKFHSLCQRVTRPFLLFSIKFYR